eukprot:TRINITY_DN286_c0_g1_i1.p1 TRINITY_DN286_c0_g1~~TRINITY_DN286_c0_g1_i1.p1  ORF type:complete len:398 (+),score=86.14 TRINITY_DN286_c0_g1_i1:356-1549(+)
MGIGVTNVGHCHPRVVKAIQEQAARITHGQVNIAFHKPMLDLLEKLLPIMPHPDLDTFFFWNSGAEAVEAAIKLARHATQKQNIVVFNGGYHGRTFGTMSLTTSKTIYRAAYGPLLPGVFVAPFPKFFQERLRYGSRVSEGEIVSRCLEEIEMMLKEQTAPGETCAFLVEPVLGEGGYIPTPPSFMKGLREITKKNNILLIVDEVQTGFGRTGKWFGVEHSGVVPDILVFAKGVASGVPLSGIVSTRELMSSQPAGSMGGTYAGNAVSCAAAIATIDIMNDEKILENVKKQSHVLFSGLHEISSRYTGCIGDIRGLGLMVGVEFFGEKIATIKEKKGNPKFSLISDLTLKCLEEGLLLLSCGSRDVVRFIPALNVGEEELKLGLSRFERALERTLTE